ncbi:uncharacterized protein L3040_000588 [Drepanopeziza brunnea f. sp. 'multigermtubi']|uniref:Nuclear pore complex protein Nup85 n=1 Tax=Marssonina brunnea f. sp. multigermtubi (strain MB_m1) TaxID=1072389 RepID=K1X8G8_MARBU|nr:aconitate hydratase [Drepanopeziza brunnea f. sp. 'multigermtubi' MB_m1]EKD21376.1 aconitate hydratase [Drepanopeziza brunnea f. sp. 'multigermtubi' MB_m1]KAJ5054311.1 hypothetical protein L3040_000588 [Drepanopeziza brunnea f. sp. 'multigermtubi']
MAFQVPASSSPPSTPDRRSGNSNTFPFSVNFSTTPAGPPPSSTASFTPAGQPPSLYGSSVMGGTPLKPLSFSQNSAFNPASSPPANFRRPAAPPARSGLSHEYQASPQLQRSFRALSSKDGDEYDDEDDNQFNDSQRYGEFADEIEDDSHYEEDSADADMDDGGSEFPTSRTGGNRYSQQSLRSTPGGLKRSREGELLEFGDSVALSISQPEISQFRAIAKDLYSRMEPPPLKESDELVLTTETIMEKLYQEGVGASDDDDQIEEALTSVTKELVEVWAAYRSQIAVVHSEEYTASIGPTSGAPDFEKAEFLADLTLQIQHPDKISKSFDRKVMPLPQILLEWLERKHNPYPLQLQELAATKPSPSSSKLFWESIFTNLLRGKVLGVIEILNNAGWRTARVDDETLRTQFGRVGYFGAALENVNYVVEEAAKALKECPGVRGDWNTKSSDWTLFRIHMSQALERLKMYAGGDKKGTSNVDPSLKSPMAASYSERAQKAESRVPWLVYQNLTIMYNLVLGDRDSIIENSEDWLEATTGLMIWWDEGKEDRRLALGRPQNMYRAASMEPDAISYRRKLRRSFHVVTNGQTDFEVNTASEVEVCLASLFEGDFEAVIGLMRGWSGPISSAVAEIASLGGWLPQTEENNLIEMDSLDADDLETLGLSSSPSKVDGVKDKTLVAYANSLAKRGEMRATVSGRAQTRDGWEISIAILGRLDSTERAKDLIRDFLGKFSLDSATTVDKLWKLLNDIDMPHHAEQIAESYATKLAEGTHNYGEALWYYALSHQSQKVKDVLDLLMSMSLIQSTACPAAAEMDEYLRNLVSSPQNALNEISRLDLEAAELLHKSLSGYATLRKFYDLRDQGLMTSQSKAQLGPVARKMEAASSLLAVITSSDDSIRGGLYDEERGAVVNVDFLLALLGEALVFVNQSDYQLTAQQIDTLLKAIEDLQAVGPRIYSNCTEFLQAVIASGQGLKGSSPTDLLRMSTSSISGISGSFSMVGSSMLASQLKQSMRGSGTAATGPVKRGWDWRHGISASTTGDDLLRILRLGLAKDLAKAYLLESDSRM